MHLHTHSERTKLREPRKRQHGAVWIPETGHPGAAGRRPHGEGVLLETGKALERNAPLSQGVDGRADVGNVPAQHCVRVGRHGVHRGDPQHHTIRIEDESEGLVGNETQPENVLVEAAHRSRDISKRISPFASSPARIQPAFR